MNNKPIISIVVPVYNGRPHMKRCLDSILNQTFKEWELIIVDDGSTDGTSELLDIYAANYKQVRVIHQRNSGVSYARNRGMEIAKGEFLVFQDADDSMDSTLLEGLLSEARRDSNIDMVLCGIRVHEMKETREYPPIHAGRTEEILPRHDALRYLIFFGSLAKLYKTSIIREASLSFNRELTHGEDHDFITRYLMLCRSVGVLRTSYVDNFKDDGHATKKFESGLLNIETYIRQLSLWVDIARVIPRSWSFRERRLFGLGLVARQIFLWIWINEILTECHSSKKDAVSIAFWHNLIRMLFYVPVYSVLRGLAGSIRRHGLKKLF